MAEADAKTKRRLKARPHPGYCAPYWARVKPITSQLSIDEHAQFSERAQLQGLKPTTLATQILREFLARKIPLLAPDNFEDATLVYGDGE